MAEDAADDGQAGAHVAGRELDHGLADELARGAGVLDDAAGGAVLLREAGVEVVELGEEPAVEAEPGRTRASSTSGVAPIASMTEGRSESSRDHAELAAGGGEGGDRGGDVVGGVGGGHLGADAGLAAGTTGKEKPMT